MNRLRQSATDEYRGCQMEHRACEKYGIHTMYEVNKG